MTRQGIREYVEAIRERYGRAKRREKGKILDEGAQVTGYHRKALVRLLRRRAGSPSVGRRGRPKRYGPAAAEALRLVWEASDRLCSRRLHPFMPELVGALRRHGEGQQLTAQVEAPLRQMSPATMDRLGAGGGPSAPPNRGAS